MSARQVKAATPSWLTEEQVDLIIEAASADDIVEALALYPDVSEHPMEVSRLIFDRSGERLGLTNGRTASQMVSARDFTSWTSKLRGLMASPKAEATEPSQDSATSGE